MTADEWERCTDPRKMLEFLRGKASDRKLRLFAVACCRHAWGLVRKQPSRRAVVVAEQHADGLVGPRRLATARAAARQIANDTGSWAAMRAAEPNAWRAACEAARRTERTGNLRWQPGLMREIFGPLPFRPLEPLTSGGVGRNDSPARRLAQAIYEGRRFEDLPVLADMLEESGCSDAQLLGHLRWPGPHVRGCFAVDVVLGNRDVPPRPTRVVDVLSGDG